MSQETFTSRVESFKSQEKPELLTSSIGYIPSKLGKEIIGVFETPMGGICNFSNGRIGDKEYFITALHCIIDKRGLDDNKPDTAVISYSKITKQNQIPSREISHETAYSIIGKNPTLQIYIPFNKGPDKEYVMIHEIAQENQGNPEFVKIYIPTEKYSQIFTQNGTSGASGGVVLDSAGKIFGVLSSAHRFNPKNTHQWIRISPIRNGKGVIKFLQ